MNLFDSIIEAQNWAQKQANETNNDHVVFCRNTTRRPVAIVLPDNADNTQQAPLLWPQHWATIRPEK